MKMKFKLKPHRITRALTVKECPWLDAEVPAGTIVYNSMKPTYGCISPAGTAMTLDPTGDYPFFEVPDDAHEEVVDIL